MNAYDKKLIAVRKNNLSWQMAASSKIEKTLQKAYTDLSNLILKGGDKVSMATYASKKDEIARIAKQIGVSVNSNIKSGMMESAKYSSAERIKIYDDLAKQNRTKINWGKLAGNIPTMAVQNCINRNWGGGNTFSKRIWSLTELSKNGINEIVSAGIARGQSAVDMSKDLKQFLVNPALTPGTTWTTGITKSVSGRGTIHYNALRLARTEINNSYREAAVISNAASPVTLGVKWILSDNHEKPDICDMNAKANLYGLGDGVYPANKVPIDHPNGRCGLIDVFRPPSEWGKPKTSGEKPNFNKLPDLNFPKPSQETFKSDIPMGHYTTEAAKVSILENGFNYSENSMYGQGVYFTNKSLTSEKRPAELLINLKPHKQLYIERDIDIGKIFSEKTGLAIGKLGTVEGRQAWLDAGIGSLKVNLGDGEFYTIVNDKNLILIKDLAQKKVAEQKKVETKALDKLQEELPEPAGTSSESLKSSAKIKATAEPTALEIGGESPYNYLAKEVSISDAWRNLDKNLPKDRNIQPVIDKLFVSYQRAILNWKRDVEGNVQGIKQYQEKGAGAKKWKTPSDNLTKALEALPSEKSQSFRGIGFNENKWNKVQQDIIPGGVVIFDSVSAASLKRTKAWDFLMRNEEGYGIIYNVIPKTKSNGKFIAGVDGFTFEQEVLFKKGSKFTVKSVSKTITLKRPMGHPVLFKIVELIEGESAK